MSGVEVGKKYKCVKTGEIIKITRIGGVGTLCSYAYFEGQIDGYRKWHYQSFFEHYMDNGLLVQVDSPEEKS